ncbi:MAG: site-specific integrase [Planctomycetota bacterium]|nr:site-specific integrase [Planctomycetota bacterium]
MGMVFRPKRKKKDGSTATASRWYIQFRDHSGKQVRRVGGTTKAQAQEALAEAERQAVARRNGLPAGTPATLRCRKLLEQFLKAKAAEVEDTQLDILKVRIEFILDTTRAVVVSDLSPSKVRAAVQTLEVGGNTRNKYVGALKGMLNWAVKEGLLAEHPLKHVKNGSTTESETKRRPLTIDECRRLLRAGKVGPLRRAKKMRVSKCLDPEAWKAVELKPEVETRLTLEGQRLHLLYLLMLDTGLRTNEARCIRWADLDLEVGELFCRESWTKNGEAATLPLSPTLHEALLAWRDMNPGAKPAERVIPKITRRTLHQFDDDLGAAGIEKVNPRGEVVCMHSLRHTFATRLVAAGVDIKTAQVLLRHRSPEITLKIYTHTDDQRKRRAVEGMEQVGE